MHPSPVRKRILHRTFFDIHQAEEFSLLDLYRKSGTI